MAPKSNLKASIIAALHLLSRRDRRLLAGAIAIQMATAILDLAGVILLGLVAAISVTVIQSQPAPPIAESVAEFVGLEAATPQQLVFIFGISAAAVLLTKSIVSSYLLRRVLRFLANRQALISARLTAELMRRSLTEIQEHPSQQIAYGLMTGAGAATVGLLGSLVVLATEAALLVVLATALMFLDPIVTIGAILFFTVTAYAIQKPFGRWSSTLGVIAAETDIKSLNAIQEALGAYREITVSNRRDLYSQRVQDYRWTAARVAADGAFISQVPKYVFEASLVIGALGLAGVLYLTKDSVAAVSTLAVFLAAASRVMPALLRLQGATLGIRSFAGTAQPTFDLAEWLGHPVMDPGAPISAVTLHNQLAQKRSEFDGSISVESVTYTYPGARDPSVHNVSIFVSQGQSVALVGRSGAGKSTLTDLILGILDPDEGQVLIGGLRPGEAIQRWPGGIAYVPQHIVLANDTVRSNVALGLPRAAIDDESVWQALSLVHLDDFLREQRDGLDTPVGESGVRLSGGQRQRLGLARALYTRPDVLVLDEATSALDAETELEISRTIETLATEVTTIVVAHRLSTVRSVDVVVYLEAGQIRASGSFDHVRSIVPEFARQANLFGL